MYTIISLVIKNLAVLLNKTLQKVSDCTEITDLF